MKTKFAALLMVFQLTTSLSFANENIGFQTSMYSQGGCSETYFKKAKKVNRTVGFALGGASILSSTFMPLAPIFFLGGLGAAGETGYSYIEENQDASKVDKAPRIRYPIARQYFDILNTLELNKILNANSDLDIATYIKLYMESTVLASYETEQYKDCKVNAKLKGVSRSEIKEVEKNITSYLMDLEENPEAQALNEVEKGKKEFAQCVLDIKVQGQDIYPIADMLLFKDELSKTKILTWRLKSAIRMYAYAVKKAKEQNQNLGIEKYFEIINKLDNEKEICKDEKKPLNRKNLVKELLSLSK